MKTVTHTYFLQPEMVINFLNSQVGISMERGSEAFLLETEKYLIQKNDKDILGIRS